MSSDEEFSDADFIMVPVAGYQFEPDAEDDEDNMIVEPDNEEVSHLSSLLLLLLYNIMFML